MISGCDAYKSCGVEAIPDGEYDGEQLGYYGTFTASDGEIYVVKLNSGIGGRADKRFAIVGSDVQVLNRGDTLQPKTEETTEETDSPGDDESENQENSTDSTESDGNQEDSSDETSSENETE